jgi:hypothetical protein
MIPAMTKPVTVEVLTRLARAHPERDRFNISEIAGYVGCHTASVRNWFLGAFGKQHVEALRVALQVKAVRVDKPTKAGQFVVFVSEPS